MACLWQQMEKAMIELKNVNAGYEGKTILKNVSCLFENGKINIILGRNGSGKSTLLKTCLNMIPLQSGEILIDGLQASTLPSKEMAKHTSALLQNNHAGDLSVFRMVMHGRFCHQTWPRLYNKSDEEIAYNALKSLGISHLEKRFVNELSGGEFQKVLLARCLAQEAKNIFLDEPSTWLDLPMQRELSKILKKLVKQEYCVIMIAHDLIACLELADQIFILDHGQLVFHGSPEEAIKCSILKEVFHVCVESIQIQDKTKYFIVD